MTAGRRFVNLTAPVLLFATIASTLFASPQRPARAPSPRNTQEDNIREAVFRYQFDHNASGQQKNAAVYCLSLGDDSADPSDDFVSRFEGHKPPVRKVSHVAGLPMAA